MPNSIIENPSAAPILNELRRRKPLIHCLTNQVVKNFTANALLALGAAPAMVEHPEEAAEFAVMADALLINVGTLDEAQQTAIEAAVHAAVGASKPWVLDPVAVGPLSVRTLLARRLVDYRPNIIRGNASEIIALSGQQSQGRGVDSGDTSDKALEAAKSLAYRTGGAVLVTGEVDLVTDGTHVCQCSNGVELLTRVTGVGCAQGAIAAACAAVEPSPFKGAVAAAVLMGVAGELASKVSMRPGSFQVALLDALDELDAQTLAERASLA
ncbi:MAG: Hydroxyethylthiazole kinase [Puniceicoccaceae bacterium 5H]|nr:MAG: Hydroxyethylthiazole kinase [Puniceicoccaceae bacterium 5H]